MTLIELPEPAARTRDVVLADGSSARIEPMVRGDEHTVRAVLDDLSPRSRRLRFMQAVPVVTDRLVRQLADADGVDHVAVVAWCGDRPVAHACWVRHRRDPAVAELALAVVDDRQGLGLGRALVQQLADRAACAGIDRLTWMASPENRACLRLLRSMGGESRLSDGTMEGGAPVAVLRAPS